MPKICFVPGCKTSSKLKPGKESIALFQVPKDPVLRKQWHIASRRGDREMKKHDFVCELHFTEDCIERYFTTNLFDGETFQLKRERARLKKGSIPTIFLFSESDSVPKKGRPRKLLVTNRNEDLDSRSKSPPSKYRSQVVTCSAYGCNNSSNMKLHGISFHRFPTKKPQKIWANSIGRKYFEPSRKSMICSAHFNPDQIQRTSSSVTLKPGAIPTIFSLVDSSDSNESFSLEDDDVPLQNSDEYDDDEKSLSGTDTIQEENDGISEDMSPSYRNMSLKHFVSKQLIAEGYEEVFGKFVANELKILSCDPPLYLRTKEKIWQVLEKASQTCLT